MPKPRKRTRFSGPGDESLYLNALISHHLEKGDHELVRDPCRRLAEILDAKEEDDGSIMLQVHRALLAFATGDLEQEIRYRLRAIALIERLFEIGGPIKEMNYEYMAAQYSLLAGAYRRAGKREREAKAMCREREYRRQHEAN